MASSTNPNAHAFAFGSFDYACAQTVLPLCPLVGSASVTPTCYARNVLLAADSLLFEPATLVVDFIALVMTAIMIYNIKSKYIALGSKEICMFFCAYAASILFEILLISGIIPMASPAYKYFVAIDVGIIVSVFWILLFNGFVGFQWIEDGSPASLWALRGSTASLFLTSFLIAIFTFSNTANLSSSTPTLLFIIQFVLPLVFLVLYAILQTILVVNALDDRWPLVDLLFAYVFFIVGLCLQYLLGNTLCTLASHYVDGVFFGSIFNLLAAMMIYKYWESVTREDLEFAVGGGAGGAYGEMHKLSRDNVGTAQAGGAPGGSGSGSGGSGDWATTD
ncbi:Chitin synthase, class 7 [Entophlyctis luteolus]|nr:Chitin synthase, class 7 [Entophlyctis luteolus]